MAFVSPAATGTGWIRLGHLSPDTPPVDVCVYSSRNSSARIRLPEVEYGDISPYETLGAGDYSIAIRAAEASGKRRTSLPAPGDACRRWPPRDGVPLWVSERAARQHPSRPDRGPRSSSCPGARPYPHQRTHAVLLADSGL